MAIPSLVSTRNTSQQHYPLFVCLFVLRQQIYQHGWCTGQLLQTMLNYIQHILGDLETNVYRFQQKKCHIYMESVSARSEKI